MYGDDRGARWDDNIDDLERMIAEAGDGEDEGEKAPQQQIKPQPQPVKQPSKPVASEKNWDNNIDNLEKMLGGSAEPMIEEIPKNPRPYPVANTGNKSEPAAQKQPSVRAGKTDPTAKLMSLIQMTWDANLLSSFAAIKAELDWIEQSLKDKQTPKAVHGAFLEEKEFLVTTRSSLLGKIQKGEMKEAQYKAFSKKAYDNNVNLFGKLKQQGEKFLLTKLANRLNGLKSEQDALNTPNGFEKILSGFGIKVPASSGGKGPVDHNPSQPSSQRPKSDIPLDTKKKTSEEKKIEQRPLSEFSGKESLSQFSPENNWTIEKKLMKLLERFKQYHNLATYLTVNVKAKNR